MEAINENFLDDKVEVKGSIRFSNKLRLAGKIEGDIHSEGQFELASSGEVKGNVTVQNAKIEGKLHGNVIAAEKVELKSKAEVIGDIKAARLAIEEGVVFSGKCEISPEGKLSQLINKPEIKIGSQITEPQFARK